MTKTVSVESLRAVVRWLELCDGAKLIKAPLVASLPAAIFVVPVQSKV